jgi:hypothetical protein
MFQFERITYKTYNKDILTPLAHENDLDCTLFN